jgi:hypothetical protein
VSEPPRKPKAAPRVAKPGSREPRSATPGSRVSAKTKPQPDEPKPKQDVVLIQGISDDGEALAVLRAREDRLEAGIVRAVKQGELGKGELLRLKPRPESPLVCDVEVEVPERALNAKGGSDGASHHGPAQVATPSYRANWDAIWKKSDGGKKSLPN